MESIISKRSGEVLTTFGGEGDEDGEVEHPYNSEPNSRLLITRAVKRLDEDNCQAHEKFYILEKNKLKLLHTNPVKVKPDPDNIFYCYEWAMGGEK